MTTFSGPLLKCSLVLLIAARFVGAQAQGPSFGPPLRLVDGSVELTLMGQTGANVQIEASTNLTEWASVVTGVATNGTFTYRHPASASRVLYFRGRSASDSLPAITVTPRPDTNFTASGMATVSGATVVMNGTNFIRFTLNVPSNSVPDATILNLTYITNLTSLPFAGPLIGAVQIDPTNAVFWRGATLEITYPTNIDRRKIVSFACEPNGSMFRLVIDRVYSNRVMIPITRGGIYGSVIATEQEINEVARHAISPPPRIGSEAVGMLRASAAQECNAAEKARAEAVGAQLQAALTARSSDAATILGIERQRQLVGVESDTTELFTGILTMICQFYQTQIAPHWTEAASNCALSKVLLQFALSLERQRQLLGATDDCISLSSLPLCVSLKNCLKEIGDCCDLGFKGTDKIIEVLSLQRQDQLLGLDCISNEEAQDVIDRCMTNIWSGTFSMRGVGHYYFATNRDNTLTIEIREVEGTFEGAVVESQEFGSPSAGFSITLKVVGTLSYSDLDSLSHDIRSRCTDGSFSSRYFLQESTTVASAETLYTVNIATQPDGSYIMFAGNIGSTNITIGITGTETNIELRQGADCDGGLSTENRVTREPEQVVGYGMPLYQGRLDDPNPRTISGSTTAVDDGSGPPVVNFDFHWSFERRTAAP